MSEYVLFTELSGYDSKQLDRFRNEPYRYGARSTALDRYTAENNVTN